MPLRQSTTRWARQRHHKEQTDRTPCPWVTMSNGRTSGPETREVSIDHAETTLDGIDELQFSVSAARSWSLFSIGGRRQVRSVGRVWTTQCGVGQFLAIRGVYQ